MPTIQRRRFWVACAHINLDRPRPLFRGGRSAVVDADICLEFHVEPAGKMTKLTRRRVGSFLELLLRELCVLHASFTDISKHAAEHEFMKRKKRIPVDNTKQSYRVEDRCLARLAKNPAYRQLSRGLDLADHAAHRRHRPVGPWSRESSKASSRSTNRSYRQFDESE